MADFQPYSVTRGGFSTPRELFTSVVKDLTEFYPDGNAFEVAYPADSADIDYDDPNSATNDVIIVRATNLVDPCVDDGYNQQPWVIRFDTRASIGHGNGHINITTPLQIDWSKPKAPAIPYIPPNVPYDADSVYTEGTLGFVGMRVPDGSGALAASNERGFINRAVYHTRIAQIQAVDGYGNFLWELDDGSSVPQQVAGTRRVTPVEGLTEEGKAAYTLTLAWHELTNPDAVDIRATHTSTAGDPKPAADTTHTTAGMAAAVYAPRKAIFHFHTWPGTAASALAGVRITTFKVSGDLPPSFRALAVPGSPVDADGLPQEISFVYDGSFPEDTGYKQNVVLKAGVVPFSAVYTVSWVVDPTKAAVRTPAERVVTDVSKINASTNKGLDVYDNLRYKLTPVASRSFDQKGAARDPREGALNVPMSYSLTVDRHGIVLATWDQAVDQYETNQGHRFSWFAAQRLVDKDTGKPLVDQQNSFCPLFCVYGVYHEKLATSMYFVVRESDVNRPSEEQQAGEDSPDSNAVLNTFEQVAVSEDYEYVITVPSGLTTQRYLYLEEADLIGYTSADVISNGALSEFQMYDEGTCSVTGVGDEASCKAQGGTWAPKTRLYKGLPATGKYNTGMRVLMRWYGGRLGSLQKP